MSDSSINRFVAAGTAAERAEYTPDLPSPPSGPESLLIWFETDTEDTYAFNGSTWYRVNNGAGVSGGSFDERDAWLLG